MDVGAIFARAMQQRQDENAPRPTRVGSAPQQPRVASASKPRQAAELVDTADYEAGSPRWGSPRWGSPRPYSFRSHVCWQQQKAAELASESKHEMSCQKSAGFPSAVCRACLLDMPAK